MKTRGMISLLVVIIVVVLSVLSACAGSAPTTEPTKPAPPTTTTPSTPPTSPATTTPTTPLAETPSVQPPAIPHTLEEHDNCLMCHETGVGEASKIPEDHAGRTNELCTTCHKPTE